MRAHDAERGTVVVLVLFVLSMAAYLVLEMSYAVRVEQAGSVWLRDSVHARHVAKAGLSWARTCIAADDGAPDFWGEEWSTLPMRSEAFSEHFQTGSVICTVSDEGGKFPLNALAGVSDRDISGGRGLAGVFLRLLEILASERGIVLERQDAREILARIKDWVDSDSTRTRRDANDENGVKSGNEADDYRSVTPAYGPSNRSMRTLDELRLIPMPPKLEACAEHLLQLDVVSKYFTVQQTGGSININTAPREVVMALVEDAEYRGMFRDAVLAYRMNADNDFESDWYTLRENMGGVEYGGMLPDSICGRSDVFSVIVEARSGIAKHRLAAFLTRRSAGQADEGRTVTVQMLQTL